MASGGGIGNGVGIGSMMRMTVAVLGVVRMNMAAKEGVGMKRGGMRGGGDAGGSIGVRARLELLGCAGTKTGGMG